MEFVTGEAARITRRITLIAACAVSGFFALLAVPFLYAGSHLGHLSLFASGLFLAFIAGMIWLLRFPDGRAGLPLLTLTRGGLVLHPAAQWGWRRWQVELAWSDLDSVILRRPPRGQPNFVFFPTEAAARRLNLRPATWWNNLLAGWTKPNIVIWARIFDGGSDAVLDEVIKAAQDAGRQPRKVPRWDGGAEVTFTDR